MWLWTLYIIIYIGNKFSVLDSSIYPLITERQSWRIESEFFESLHSEMYFKIYIVIVTVIAIYIFFFSSPSKFQYVLSFLFLLSVFILRDVLKVRSSFCFTHKGIFLKIFARRTFYIYFALEFT